MGIIFQFCFALISEVANINICTVLTLQNFSRDANLKKEKKLSDLWATVDIPMQCANFTKKGQTICSFFIYLNVKKQLICLFIIMKCWYSKGDVCESQAFSYVYSCLSWVLKLVIQKRIIKSLRERYVSFSFLGFKGCFSWLSKKFKTSTMLQETQKCSLYLTLNTKDILKIAERCDTNVSVANFLLNYLPRV